MIKAILLSLSSFGLLALALPPFPLGPGALVFLAPWLYVLKTANQKTALLSSYAGAFLFNAVSIYWLYHVGDVAPPALIFSGIFLAVSYLSLYTLLYAYFFVKMRDLNVGKFKMILLFPFFWAGIEVLQSKGDMSFPWLSLGLVFGNSLEMIQSYALFGVFGVSAIILASNMCVVEAFLRRKRTLLLVPAIVVITFYIGGAIAVAGEKEEEPHLIVTVVQPSIHQAKKWTKSYYDSVMTQTWDLFNTLDPTNVDLIVFPETAIPDYMNLRYSEHSFLHNYTLENNTSIMIGALNREKNDEKRRKFNIYNSAFLFGSGYPALEYSKMHLVPFSEKVPFDNIFPVVNYVDLGGGDFTAGDSLTLWQPGNFSPLICYEAIYGSILRKAKRKGATFIANITNDGWFYKSTAPYQHLNLVRAHAVENGIGIVRSANTGISAFIRANGEITERTELFEIRTLTGTVPLKTRFTPYYAIGDYIEYALFAFSLILMLVVLFLRKKMATNR